MGSERCLCTSSWLSVGVSRSSGREGKRGPPDNRPGGAREKRSPRAEGRGWGSPFGDRASSEPGVRWIPLDRVSCDWRWGYESRL